eukprot:TRINITY_DN89926_c0_g1_i1.p1 TRINITY_DN89926_c0_g1~~TRINITY_DN89926_c0_g1_i1.p1  ORF type:complete len:288 (+),score=58.16 TRINITY_DN89926_c0_g1_i1:40-903(+)
MSSSQISNMEEGTDEPLASDRGSAKKKAKKPLRLLLQDYEKREEALQKSHLESCGKQVLSVYPSNPNFTFSYAPRMASESISRTPRAALGQEAAAADVDEQPGGGGEGGQEAATQQSPPSAEATAKGAANAQISKQHQLLKDAQKDRERVMLTRFGESKRVQHPVVASTNASPFSCTYPYPEPRPPPPPPAGAEELPPTSAPAPTAKVQKYCQAFEARQKFYLGLQSSPHESKLRSYSAGPAFSFGRSLVGCRQRDALRAKSRKVDLDKLRDRVNPAELKVDWPSGF